MSVLTACTAAPAPVAPVKEHRLEVSSETSVYAVRGHFSGTYTVTQDTLRATITEAAVISTTPVRAPKLRLLLAHSTPDGWDRVASSQPYVLGPFGLGDRRVTGDTIAFVLALPKAFDPAQHWFVFEFAFGPDMTTYACSTTNLAGPDSIAAHRARLMARNYSLGC